MDWSQIIIACIAFLGTLAGSYFSANKTTALISMRLENLEKRVEAHNNLISRMYSVESRVTLLEDKLK